MNIVPTKSKRSSQNTENIELLAQKEIYSGMRKYLSEKTSPIDPYTDIYYLARALVMGALAFAWQETQDPESAKRVIKIVDNAVMNAIKDWTNTDLMKKPGKN
tara:strand:+ start:2068 stop:2376 length:309 start_codon:yes stop_codon:yes gene_type:complete